MRKILVGSLAFALTVFLALGFQREFYEVPILMYHQVNHEGRGSSVTVRPDNFERQMEFLKVHRYHVISLETLIRDLKAGRRIPPKTVAITFDDGTVDNIRFAFPVLRKMGFPATVFMITDNIDRPGWLSGEDLKIMNEGGISIGSHTVSHAFLPELETFRIEKELLASKDKLRTLLGHDITLFSYPAGGVTPEIQKLVEKTGYAGAVTTNYGKKRHDPYALHRIKAGDSSWNLFKFWTKISGFYSLGKKRVAVKVSGADVYVGE